ncbi:50S ribosomal protein L11 [Candidatus Woesearchaeota archaeon]|nr:50S ribosomal protein L11 [Candidatus Woesearchaeota archaeon]
MAKETVDALIVGGKASAAPPLGPALGPKGVNIGQVVAEINKKTADFAGMQVPVKVIIETNDKSFEIEIGTPPATALIKQELDIKKASGTPQSDYVGDLTLEQVKKITRMKEGAVTGKNQKMRVKEILGTCRSMGVTINGKKSSELISEINAGNYDKELADE